MDNALHAHYLGAMGIEVWRSRDAPTAPAAEPPPVEGSHAGAPAGEATPPAAEDSTRQDSSSGCASPSPHLPRGGGHAGSGSPAQGAVEAAGLEWGALQAKVKGCRACPLHETRSNTVFGVGDPGAELLIVGEAPGADEDRQGEPFVGRAGQLLDTMLAAIGLDRGRVFIANTIKCRPPGNRDPHIEESMQCRPYLLRQIELIQPRLILATGLVAAQNLLERDDSLARMRGRRHHFGPERIPLIISYHPAYLLRLPDQKGKAWQDLQQVAAELGHARR